MREDMAKVLVERPRVHGGEKYPRAVQRGPLEEQPRREAIKSPLLHSRKELNENLAPLRRFLRSRVGRPWDQVYSEICERINRDSAVQLHIWQHLMWEVARDPLTIQRLRTQTRSGWRSRFYVDPKSRTLLETPCSPRELPARESFLTKVRGRSFKQIHGIWYEIELRPLPPTGQPVWDAVISRLKPERPRFVDLGELKRTYGRGVYAAGKRQLNKREIQRLMATLTAR